MKITTDIARIGYDYTTLTVKEGKGLYRMKTLANFVYETDEDIIAPNTRLIFRDKDFIPRLKIEPRLITVYEGYAWNGNSPKRGFRILWKDIWIGTPDFFPQTVKSSGLHDALFQFSGLRGMPVSLYQANDFYYQIATAHGHLLNDMYYLVLRNCSNRYWGNSAEGLTCEMIEENIEQNQNI